jgi:amidase
MIEPCDLDAVAARRLIGAKKVAPTELLESCIGLIEAVGHPVNAIGSFRNPGAFCGVGAFELRALGPLARGAGAPIHWRSQDLSIAPDITAQRPASAIAKMSDAI